MVRLVAVAMLAVVAMAQDEADPPARPPTIEELAAQLVEPGPESATRRLQALNALILLPDLAAHAALQAEVRERNGRDDNAQRILEILEGRIATPGDPVFGDPERRGKLLAGYVGAILSLFEKRWATEPVAPSVEALCTAGLRVVRVLPVSELPASLDAALGQAAVPARERAALYVAGRSRRVGVAPWIATRLDRPELASAAQRALRDLVHVADDFADSAAFAAWYDAHRDRSYLELVEAAARDATERIRAVEAESRRRIRELDLRLVRALADSPAPDWPALTRTILERGDHGSQAELLGCLAEVLARRLRAGEELGGLGPDRAAFAAALAAAIDESDAATVPAMLEALAYLRVAAEPTALDDVRRRLRTALLSADTDLRAASLRGLAFHPGPVRRAAVVEAARTARAKGDTTTLSAAFDCLLAPGWRAPSTVDPDRGAFVALVDDVLRDPQFDLGLAERALDVGLLRSSDERPIPELWELVAEIASDETRDVNLRRLALSHLTSPGQDSALAARFVAVLAGRLADPDDRMRRLAASLIRNLPPTASLADRDAWHATLVAAAEERLTVEPDPRVIRALTDAMLSIARTPEQVGRWIDAKARAARVLAAAEDVAAVAARRAALLDALRLSALDRTTSASAWVRAAQGLVALGARDALIDVLERHDPLAQPPERSSGSQTDRAAALGLLFDAAALAAPPWDFRARSDEAQTLAAALTAIESGGSRLEDPNRITVAAEALLAVGDTTRADAVAARALDAGAARLDPASQARLATIRALVAARQDRSAEAIERLRDVERVTRDLPALASRAAELRLEIARAEYGADRLAEARELLAPLLAPGVERTPLWSDAFLLDGGCRLGLLPDRELIDDLREQAEWFSGEAVSGAQAALFQELLRRAAGDGNR